MSKWAALVLGATLTAVQAWADPAAPRDLSAYKEEPVPGGALLVAAYGVMWLLVALAVGRLLRSQAKLEQDIRELEQRLERTP